jgi:antitoxin (DNA-binding transcriptional repressor) of toxin-antitoxin stability system
VAVTVDPSNGRPVALLVGHPSTQNARGYNYRVTLSAVTACAPCDEGTFMLRYCTYNDDDAQCSACTGCGFNSNMYQARWAWANFTNNRVPFVIAPYSTLQARQCSPYQWGGNTICANCTVCANTNFTQTVT